MEEPRKRIAGKISGLDIHYDLGEGHPLLGRRMPDLELNVGRERRSVYSYLYAAKPVLFSFGDPIADDVNGWTDRVQHAEVSFEGEWKLPVLGKVTAPNAVLVRPDGYVAWVDDGDHVGLTDALTKWFGASARSE